MFVTLVAVLISSTGLRVEEIVTDSALSDITWQECQIHGQMGIIEWMRHDPRYHANWKVESYKCVPGHYEIKGRA